MHILEGGTRAVVEMRRGSKSGEGGEMEKKRPANFV
jgi:hypothetical protein